MHWPFLHGIGTLLQQRTGNENVIKRETTTSCM